MAEALGGHLVTITSAEENQFLIDTFHVNHKLPVWIGFTDEAVEGDWQWITGEAVTFNGWVDGRPDNTNNEDAAVMGSSWGFDHLWNDVNIADHAPFFYRVGTTASAGVNAVRGVDCAGCSCRSAPDCEAIDFLPKLSAASFPRLCQPPPRWHWVTWLTCRTKRQADSRQDRHTESGGPLEN
jgi:hypothetical protein